MTVDEFERMSGSEFYELVDGYLKERKVSTRSNWVAVKLSSALVQYAERSGGVPLGEGVELAIDPARPRTLVYKPDGAFVSHGRIPGDMPGDGFLDLPPDLVIEVASPGNDADELLGKAIDYLRFGVELVWLVFPERKLVQVLTRGSNMTELVWPGTPLTGGEVLPGLSIDLARIFQVAPEPA